MFLVPRASKLFALLLLVSIYLMDELMNKNDTENSQYSLPLYVCRLSLVVWKLSYIIMMMVVLFLSCELFASRVVGMSLKIFLRRLHNTQS